MHTVPGETAGPSDRNRRKHGAPNALSIKDLRLLVVRRIPRTLASRPIRAILEAEITSAPPSIRSGRVTEGSRGKREHLDLVEVHRGFPRGMDRDRPPTHFRCVRPSVPPPRDQRRQESRVPPIPPEPVHSGLLADLAGIEPVDSDLRRAARPSTILEALRADARILEVKSVRFIPMLRGIRTLQSLPGGLARPRPSGFRPFGRGHGVRDHARLRRAGSGRRRIAP